MISSIAPASGQFSTPADSRLWHIISMRTPPVIPPPIPRHGLTPEEIRELAYAKSILENPGLTARLSNLLGSPIEKGFKLLPKGWAETVNKTSRAALLKALEVAVVTMGASRKPRKASERFHKL